MSNQKMIVREFTRSNISEMTPEAFLALHEFAITQAEWNQNRDSLVFAFTENTWLFLVLKYPELAAKCESL
jgi:hypothetical protein